MSLFAALLIVSAASAQSHYPKNSATTFAYIDRNNEENDDTFPDPNGRYRG
jgi:hypothetical protein